MNNRRFTDRWDKANIANVSGLADEWITEFMQFCINNRPDETRDLSLNDFILGMSDSEFEDFIKECVRKF